MNGSKKYDKGSGWYDLDESVYKGLIAKENSYQAIILGQPEVTFIFPKRPFITFLANSPNYKVKLKIPDGCSLFRKIIPDIC